jgi:hypothetical protein
MLLSASSLSDNKRHAVIVRLSEKRILRKVISRLQTLIGLASRTQNGGSLKRSSVKDGFDKQAKKAKRR